MPSSRPRSIAHIAVLASLGFALAGCVSSEGMYGSDGDAPDTALVKGIMKTLGAVDPDEKPIAYEPRAPLAMPGDHADLPAPETASATPENWPRDRDAELADIRREADRRAADGKERLEKANPRLGIEEVKQGTVIGEAPASSGPNYDKNDANWENSHNRLTLDQMKGQNSIARPKAEASLFDAQGNPRRRYLVEPPVEYSTPAATAAMPDIKAIETEADKPMVDTIDGYDARRDKPR
ncbi:hypothetical protein [Breoghania sp.]|uniref:hypothetical protein n=1 Tax=Breoghania sp. TaxID=2065378 RepID=UPI002AAAFA30|nr:hypothetical protein [Breoghania sp.]